MHRPRGHHVHRDALGRQFQCPGARHAEHPGLGGGVAGTGLRTEGGAVMVDNARVIKTDVMASNGVIHVIDSVVLPN